MPTLCGGGACPSREIRRGDAVLVLSIAGLQRKLVRCCRCAGEPVPDLPALIERSEIKPSKPMMPIRTFVGALPLDYKLVQAGREPGEDDE